MHKNQLRPLLLENPLLKNTPLHLIEQHLARLDQNYFDTFSAETVSSHIAWIYQVITEKKPTISFLPLEQSTVWQLTLVGYDAPGLFSVLAGLLGVHQFDIRQGHIFTYHAIPPQSEMTYPEQRKKIIDVIEVISFVDPEETAQHMAAFVADMNAAMEQLEHNAYEKIRYELYQKIGTHLAHSKISPSALMPMEISIDTKPDTAPETLNICIKGKDTPVFLFSLSNALTSQGIDIISIDIQTHGDNVEDKLVVSDRFHRLSRDPRMMHKLKMALALIKHFTYVLPMATDYHQAFHHFQLFIDQILSHDDMADQILDLDQTPILAPLASLMGSGSYLWEQFIKMQYSTLIPFLKQLPALHSHWDKEHKIQELHKMVAAHKNISEQFVALNQFKDQELFYIDLIYLMHPQMTFSEFSKHLSDLAEIVIAEAITLIYQDLVQSWGAPMYDDKTCAFGLFALGKFGGEELGYASDLELILIYEGFGFTNAPSGDVSNDVFFNELVRRLQKNLPAKSQGIFEMDFRLRPHGEKGSLSVSFKQWHNYYRDPKQCHPFEIQALLKLRSVFGHDFFTQKIMEDRETFFQAWNPFPIAEIWQLRNKQMDSLLKPGELNAKYSPGTLVDIEYLVQTLQLEHGITHPHVRCANTLKALEQLLKYDLISPTMYEQLSNAYSFWRRLINTLRMVRGHAKDLLIPKITSDEFLFLTKRMHYQDKGHFSAIQQLQNDIEHHRLMLQNILHHQDATGSGLPELIAAEHPSPQHIKDVLAPLGIESYAEVYATLKNIYHTAPQPHLCLSIFVLAERYLPYSPDPDKVIFYLEQFLNKAPTAMISYIFFDPPVLDLLLSIFGHSDFLAQWICQNPDYSDMILNATQLQLIKSKEEMVLEIEELRLSCHSLQDSLQKLRQYRNREMVRIGIQDIYQRQPFVRIIQEISHLADVIIKETYELVLFYAQRPDLAQQWAVIAMGKCGGEELNYSSDIDLVFVLADTISDDDRMICMHLAQEFIEHLGAMTEYGQLFRVDMRLRPHGRSGPLAMKASTTAIYYQREAEGIEIQAWLKARAVCGADDLGRPLIHTIQQIMMQPQRQMAISEHVDRVRRQQLEVLQSHDEDEYEVKLGSGGIRSIEFFVQKLQIIHAPHYPDLISGHSLHALSRLSFHGLLSPDKSLALKEAYIYLRRVEHCLQLLGFQQTHMLPKAGSKTGKDLHKLAKRMGYQNTLQKKAEDVFMDEYRHVTDVVRQQTKA